MSGIRAWLTRKGRETPEQPDATLAFKSEQYLMHDLRVEMQNGVAVIVLPLHHRITTLRLTVEPSRRALHGAQRELEHTLRQLERRFVPTPAGLGITVTWGLSYFRQYVPGPSRNYLPVDNRASKASGEVRLAVLDAIKFPSDPEEVILEQNDAAVILRSDLGANIDAAADALFASGLAFWQPTSIRKGFIGGDGIGLPKRMALEAGIPGAQSIPDGAQMFLGFTSSQKAALGGDTIANFETVPGLTDQWPTGYFRFGCAMHLAHLFEDLESWYGRFTFQDRVDRSFRPGLQVAAGTLTVNEGPSQVQTESQVVEDLQRHQIVGHSASLQPATRLQTDLTDNYGNFYPSGTAVPQRADFNTIDNPFHWTADPDHDHWSERPAAGLHFLVFVPTSDAFHHARRSMDGHYPDGTILDIAPRSPQAGMNSVLRTSHRQNFLVPPRLHRSFPLAELL